MVVTRNSQQSSKPTKVESMNKLIANRKEEKRKKKKVKLVVKETTSNLLDKVDEGKSSALVKVSGIRIKTSASKNKCTTQQ